MSAQGQDKVARYRKRAEEMREIAAKTNDATAKAELLTVAKQYDKLANDLEQSGR